jgi:hypothetical protein
MKNGNSFDLETAKKVKELFMVLARNKYGSDAQFHLTIKPTGITFFQ